jgi:hypothetical protein
VSCTYCLGRPSLWGCKHSSAIAFCRRLLCFKKGKMDILNYLVCMHVHIFAPSNGIWINWWIFIKFGMMIVPTQATSYFWFTNTAYTMTCMHPRKIHTVFCLKVRTDDIIATLAGRQIRQICTSPMWNNIFVSRINSWSK